MIDMAERTRGRPCNYCGTIVRGRGVVICEGCRTREHQCETCGVLFRRVRKKNPRFCSQRCRRKPTNLRVKLECGYCGATYERYPSQVSKGRGKFCSRRCAGLGRPINGKPSQIATDAIHLFLSRCPVLAEGEKRIGRWSVDLALPIQAVAVELDGCYWHSLPAMVDRDRRKDAWLTDHGWTVLRIVIEKDDSAASVAARIEEGIAPWIKSPRRRGRGRRQTT